MKNRGFVVENLLTKTLRIVLPSLLLLVFAVQVLARESQDDQNAPREPAQASSKKVELYLDDGNEYDSNMEVRESKSTRPNAEYIDLRGPANKTSIGY